jgi:sarcosine oxidase, subunit beta
VELRRAGVDRVVVLEREGAVGRASSSRANGGVRAQFSTAVNVAFSLHSIGEFERLARAHPDVLTFHQRGYLFTTGPGTGEGFLRRAAQLQRSMGVATKWLEPDEIVALAPIVGRNGLAGGTWHARDGWLDPHGVIEVLRREAKAAGAELRFHSEVSAIGTLAGDEFQVVTSAGPVSARHVVNAAGAHARTIGEMLNIEIPVIPIRRNLAFVRVPSAPGKPSPMCVDLDTGVLVRQEGDGYVIAYSNPDDKPGWDTSIDPCFLGDLADRIGNRFPSLESAPIDPRHCWAGLYPETADHHAIVGESPEVPRFVQCAGFGGHGIMHAPAAGRAVAEIVTQGSCITFDLHPLRPTRFDEGDLTVEAAII